VVEFAKGAKTGNFVREKSGERSAIGEETFVVFCVAALYVLQVADDCWNIRSKMMSHYVFYSEICAILGDRKRTIHL